MFSTIAISASLLAIASQVSAGNAIVKNSCSQDVYLSVVTNVAGDMQTIASGDSYSGALLTNPDGGGVSIKIANTSSMEYITQFEYTVGTGAWGQLWYDISDINGNPFLAGGMTVTGSDSSCRTILCEAGILCGQAYNEPDENYATASCGNSDVDLTMTLCPGNTDDSSSSGSTTTAAKPSTSTPTASVQAAQVVESTSTTAYPTTSTPSSTSTYIAPTTTVAPTTTEAQAGGVTTTFVTKVQTVYADAPAETDATFFHHPASDGAFWDGLEKRAGAEQRLHKRAAHRHHFNRHFEVDN